ncbi:MAG: hypothetical protein M3352_07885 [Bacteroidota bacterium]|nr:hypothetical protein [Bacteroidota bacterium]
MEYRELPENVCEILLIELFQSISELLQKAAPDGFINSPFILRLNNSIKNIAG